MHRPLYDWMGSLIQDHRDQSGLLYRRNRYYDPNSGQFTQMDPIGIAGGLNVYGFANGDPITYSDPFGLSACNPDKDPDCTRGQQMADWGAQRGGFLGSLALNAGAALEAVNAIGSLIVPTSCEGGSCSAGGPAVGPSPASARAALQLSKQLASQAQMAERGVVIAGGQSGTTFRNAGHFAEQFGGPAADWVKKTSSSFRAADGTKFRTHWVENIQTGLRTAYKTIFSP